MKMLIGAWRISAFAIVAAIAAGGFSSISSAAIIVSGTLDSTSGTDTIDLFPAGDTNWEESTLAWSVDQTAGVFTYEYTFTVPNSSKAISHLSIQVSDDFSSIAGNCSLTGSSGDNIADCTSSAANDPTSPNDEDGTPLFSIKLDNTSEPSDVFSVTYTLVTDVSPVWGDFYAKDGNLPQQGGTIEATNSGYTAADPLISDCAMQSGNADNSGDCAFGFLATPDSSNGSNIPEPATLALFGVGLVGLGFLRRRR